jgi:hypothetical protein
MLLHLPSIPVPQPAEGDIRRTAYRLWEAAGRPPGRDLEFWFAARARLGRAAPALWRYLPRVAGSTARNAQPGTRERR